MSKNFKYQLRPKRARVIAKELGDKPFRNLAFNFVNYQSYRYQFLGEDIRHPTQVFILDMFILLSDIFLTKHGTSWFFHSQTQLKTSLGMSPKTIKKVVDVLAAKKLLQVKRATPTSKTYYKLCYPALMRQYKGFLEIRDNEDENERNSFCAQRLRYFAYLAKFAKMLDKEDGSKTATSIPTPALRAKKATEVKKPKKSLSAAPKLSPYVDLSSLGTGWIYPDDPINY